MDREKYFKEGYEISKDIKGVQLSSKDIIEMLNIDADGNMHGVSDALLQAYFIGIAQGYRLAKRNIKE